MNRDTQAALNSMFEIQTPEPDPLVPTVVPDATPVVVTSALQSATPTAEEERADEDFHFSRGALKSLAVEAQQTLHRAVEVAEQTDKASSFTAVAELLRATLEAHRELQQLHKTSAEIKIAAQASHAPQAQVNIQQGVVFNGTPAELLKLIDPSRQ